MPLSVRPLDTIHPDFSCRLIGPSVGRSVADLGAGLLSTCGKPEGCFEGGADPHLHLRAAKAVGGAAVRRCDQQAMLCQATDGPPTLLRYNIYIECFCYRWNPYRRTLPPFVSGDSFA